jgi:hypothetical protein
MGVTADRHPLMGWTPIAVDFDDDRPVMRWCFTEGIEFTDPFFDQTVERCLQDPFRLLFWRQTGVEALAELSAVSPGLQPSGLIFHMSRCGSTLLTQMLAGLDDALVMSEPPVIDRILRARTHCPGVSDAEIVHWVRSMASALGQPRRPGQTRFVVKLDSWAVLQWPLIRRAFPDAACIFLYRDPLEVMVSHLGHRGYHMIPGTLPADLLGLSHRESESLTAEQFGAAVLRRLCEAGLAAARDGMLRLVNYSALPEAVPEVIAPFFDFPAGSYRGPSFADIAEQNAKNPSIPFVPDGAAKRTQATPSARDAVEAGVRPVYEELEGLRLASL